jgi:hypothetical protein
MAKDILEAIQKTIFSAYNETSSKKVGKQIKLTEDKEEAKCREVTFEISGEVLICKFDKVVQDEEHNSLKHPLIFLSQDKPIRSLCDYIVFYKKENNKGAHNFYCLICNMKSDSTGNMEDQMLSGQILSDFIIKTAIRCYNSWNSETKNPKILLEYPPFIVKEIAIYSTIPSGVSLPKGNSKPKKNEAKRRYLLCNQEYNLDSILY